jgi:DNA-binding transcriptional ArsR family regulator
MLVPMTPPSGSTRAERLDAVFHALADSHRRALLQRLEGGAQTVGELAEPLPISLAAASKHLQVLERAGLVRKEAVGRRRVCALDPRGTRAAAAWLERFECFWDERLDALQQALASADTHGVTSRPADEMEATDA